MLNKKNTCTLVWNYKITGRNNVPNFFILLQFVEYLFLKKKSLMEDITRAFFQTYLIPMLASGSCISLSLTYWYNHFSEQVQFHGLPRTLKIFTFANSKVSSAKNRRLLSSRNICWKRNEKLKFYGKSVTYFYIILKYNK